MSGLRGGGWYVNDGRGTTRQMRVTSSRRAAIVVGSIKTVKVTDNVRVLFILVKQFLISLLESTG